jgi:hypothetical protein
MEDAMNTLATRLTVTAAIAALIAATPVSLGLVRPTAGADSTPHLALTLDAAQARGFGHGGGFRGESAFQGGRRDRLGLDNTNIIANISQRDGALIRRRHVGQSLGLGMSNAGTFCVPGGPNCP